MAQTLQDYLVIHRAAVNSAALQIAGDLAGPDDDGRDARRLIAESRAALLQAIANSLKVGPIEGLRYGVAGEVCVAVRVPRDGQGTLGRIGVSVGRLGWGPMIPCPDEWPQESRPVSVAAGRLQQMLYPRPEGNRIAEVDDEGRLPLGSIKAGTAFTLEYFDDGKICLTPLEHPQSAIPPGG